jgi:hypothetical protein
MRGVHGIGGFGRMTCLFEGIDCLGGSVWAAAITHVATLFGCIKKYLKLPHPSVAGKKWLKRI